jgi:hypothetical protein
MFFVYGRRNDNDLFLKLKSKTKEEAIKEAVGLPKDWRKKAERGCSLGANPEDMAADIQGKIFVNMNDDNYDDTYFDGQFFDKLQLIEVSEITDISQEYDKSFNEINSFELELEERESKKEEIETLKRLKKKYPNI